HPRDLWLPERRALEGSALDRDAALPAHEPVRPRADVLVGPEPQIGEAVASRGVALHRGHRLVKDVLRQRIEIALVQYAGAGVRRAPPDHYGPRIGREHLLHQVLRPKSEEVDVLVRVDAECED